MMRAAMGLSVECAACFFQQEPSADMTCIRCGAPLPAPADPHRAPTAVARIPLLRPPAHVEPEPVPQPQPITVEPEPLAVETPAAAEPVHVPAPRVSLPDEAPGLRPPAPHPARHAPEPGPSVGERFSSAASDGVSSLQPTGIIVAVCSLACLAGALVNPVDGTSMRALSHVLSLAGVVAGLALAFNVAFARHVTMVVLAIAFGSWIFRGDLLVAAITGSLGAGVWLRTNEDDDQRPGWAWALVAPAIIAALFPAIGALSGRMPIAGPLAVLRRQVTGGALSSLATNDGIALQFPGSGWRQRSDAEDEWSDPASNAIVNARVELVKDDSAQPDQIFEAVTHAWASRGWTAFSVTASAPLTDWADSSTFIDFSFRQGFTASKGFMRISTVDDQRCVVTAMAPERESSLLSELRQTVMAAKCRLGMSGGLSAELEAAMERSLVTVIAGNVTTLGVVVEVRAGRAVIAVGEDLKGGAASWPAAASVRPARLPDVELEPATVVRRSVGVALLTTPATENLSAARVGSLEGQSRAIAAGVASDTRLRVREGQVTVTPDAGVLAFPRPAHQSSGPLFGADGAVIGIADPAKGRVVPLAALQKVEPTLRELAWRADLDTWGHCQLTVEAGVDDPFRDNASVGIFLVGSNEQELARVSATEGRAVWSGPIECPFRGVRLSVRLLGRVGFQAITPPLPTPPTLPATVRGRLVNPDLSGEADSGAIARLFEPRSQPTLSCATAKGGCAVACRTDDQSCLVSGLELLAGGRDKLALNDFERACGKGNLEACVQVGFLAANEQTNTNFKGVLQPWCDAGYQRACNAINASGWREQVKSAASQCTSATACAAEAQLLLAGPRKPSEVLRARGALSTTCRRGEAESCVLLGEDYVRTGDYAEARATLDPACQKGNQPACAAIAGLYAAGLSVPRSVASATGLLAKACASGVAEACAVVPPQK